MNLISWRSVPVRDAERGNEELSFSIPNSFPYSLLTSVFCPLEPAFSSLLQVEQNFRTGII